MNNITEIILIHKLRAVGQLFLRADDSFEAEGCIQTAEEE